MNIETGKQYRFKDWDSRTMKEEDPADCFDEGTTVTVVGKYFRPIKEYDHINVVGKSNGKNGYLRGYPATQWVYACQLLPLDEWLWEGT